jgi:hypothetical protein
MRYVVEEYEPGRFDIVDSRYGGQVVLYDDVSDLYEEQRLMLAELHSNDKDMDWETAWDLIQAKYPEREPTSDWIPPRWY